MSGARRKPAPRALAGLAALLLALPAAGIAQAPAARPAPDTTGPRRPAQDQDSARAPRRAASADYWSFYLVPYPSYNPLEGLGLYLVGGWRKAAPPGPIPTGISIEPSAQISTSGTRGAQILFDQSGRWPGWRLLLVAGVLRWQRAPYFGLGNGSTFVDSLEEAYGVPYNSYALTRTTALAAVRRRIAGPLHLQVGAQWRSYAARPVEGRRTRLGDDLGAGVPLDTGSAKGLELRAGLLFDTRDEEASAARGVFIEALYARGLEGAGDLGYTRYGLSLREYVPITEFTSLTFRQSVELSEGHLPFFVALERMTSWRPEDGFGGVTSLRSHLPGRFTGPNKALVSADWRYRNWDFWVTPTTPVRLYFLFFADVGRVWGDGEKFAVRHLHAGGGAGTRLQVGRGGFFGFDLGWSPDAGVTFFTAVSLAY